jgi:hypothetical protein
MENSASGQSVETKRVKLIAEYEKRIEAYEVQKAAMKEQKIEARRNKDEGELDFLISEINRLNDLRQLSIQMIQDLKSLG